MSAHPKRFARLGLAALAAAACAGPALGAPEVEQWTHPRGVRAFYVHAPQIPMVDIALRFDAGGTRVGEQYGLAGFTASMLKAGADGMSLEEISKQLDELGAHIGTGASLDSTSVSLRSLSDAEVFDKALALMIRVLSKPDFPDKHFRRKKKSRLAALDAENQNIGAIVRRRFAKLIYGDHPYAHRTVHETIIALTLDDVRRFHEKYYVANNLAVVIVGDITRERAGRVVDDIAASLKTGEKPGAIPKVAPLTRPSYEFVAHPSQQVHVRIGQPFIPIGHPDFHALYLGNSILGGGGFTSRIMREIRVKRGLAYSSHSSFNTKREAGVFAVAFQTRADQKDLAISVVNDILRDFVENGPTDEELELARKAVLGGLPFRFASNDGILRSVVRVGYFGLPLEYLHDFGPRIESVTREDIVDAFRRHLNPDALATLVVGGAAP